MHHGITLSLKLLTRFTIDASFIGLDAILLQPNSKNKIQTVPYNAEQFQHARTKSFNKQ